MRQVTPPSWSLPWAKPGLRVTRRPLRDRRAATGAGVAEGASVPCTSAIPPPTRTAATGASPAPVAAVDPDPDPTPTPPRSPTLKATKPDPDRSPPARPQPAAAVVPHTARSA